MQIPLLKPPDDSHEFKPLLAEIEDSPGSPLGPLTFWLVIAVFGFFVLWSIFGEIDVVVSGRGKVIPVGNIKTIQPLNNGVVSQILVKEGDFVRKGQALVVIDPSTTEPELESARKNLAYIEQERSRLQAASSGQRFKADDGAGTQASMYQAQRASLQKQLRAKQEILNNLNAQISAKRVEVSHLQEKLAIDVEKEKRFQAVEDIIAREDYEKVTTDILAGRNRIRELEYELQQLAYQQEQTREEMAYLREDFKSNQLRELSEKEKQINQLSAVITESAFRNAQQTLTSPVDGYVHEMAIHTVGGVVSPAEKLITVVPVNTPLTIEAVVLNKDIGYIHKNMPVSIKIDTFDFQKYGTLDGKVIQIDPNSREDEKLGPVYTVFIKPLQHQLKVDGKWQRISSGMSLSAEIKVGKRRIIEFFIYPLIKHLDEGMSVR